VILIKLMADYNYLKTEIELRDKEINDLKL